MKQLHEYETPETDAETITEEPDGAIIMRDWVGADYARDMERRLAACREALGMITTHYPSDNQCENGYSPSHIALEALALTAPKQ